jgi:hypothetical protein
LEGLVQLPPEDIGRGTGHAEPREEYLGVSDRGGFRRVHDHRYLREQVEPRDVVLVGVGDGDGVDAHADPASPVDLQRRVDQDAALRSADQQRVAGRIAAALR